jgi:hypothetical protein
VAAVDDNICVITFFDFNGLELVVGATIVDFVVLILVVGATIMGELVVVGGRIVFVNSGFCLVVIGMVLGVV